MTWHSCRLGAGPSYVRQSLPESFRGPTNPHAQPEAREFDVADLYRGPVAAGDGQPAALPLDEKLRQAYFWIVNHAVISPFYDIEYHDGPVQSYVFGDAKGTLTLPSGQSYCSFRALAISRVRGIRRQSRRASFQDRD